MYYIYDSRTYEYIGESSIQTVNSTTVKPPKKGEHQAILWQSDEWYIVEDWRGTHVYSYNGCVDMEITGFGPLPLKDGYTLIPPPPERDGEERHFLPDKSVWECSVLPGWIYDNMVPRPMTEYERVKYGIDELPPECKIEGTSIVPKTPYELYNDGLIDLEKANNMIRRARENEYINNTDKYGLMYLRGEVTMEFWQEEIQKVKDNYPYIEV